MRWALALLAVIVVACIAGTVMPQGDAVSRYVEQHPSAAGRMKVLTALGLTDVFHCWWFMVMLALLAISLASCGLCQARSLGAGRGSARGRAVGSLLLHASVLVILGGALIRGVWGQRGYMRLHQDVASREFASSRGRVELPFAVRLTRFEIETEAERHAAASSGSAESPESSESLLIRWGQTGQTSTLPVRPGAAVQVLSPDVAAGGNTNVYAVRILNRVLDFSMDPASHVASSLSDEPRNPAIQVEVNGPAFASTNWLFARFPMFRMPGRSPAQEPFQMIYQWRRQAPAREAIKNFRSTVVISEGEGAASEASIAVNAPLKVKGYTLYQSGYDPDDASRSTILVVRDPGVPVVYSGFVMMLTGLFLVLYVWPGERGRSGLELPRDTPESRRPESC